MWSAAAAGSGSVECRLHGAAVCGTCCLDFGLYNRLAGFCDEMMQTSSLQDVPAVIKTAMQTYFSNPDPERFGTGATINPELGQVLDPARAAGLALERLIVTRAAAFKLAVKKKRHPSITDECERLLKLAQRDLVMTRTAAPQTTNTVPTPTLNLKQQAQLSPLNLRHRWVHRWWRAQWSLMPNGCAPWPLTAVFFGRGSIGGAAGAQPAAGRPP